MKRKKYLEPDQIQLFLERTGMQQKQLVELMNADMRENHIGDKISTSTLCRWLKGARGISDAYKIASFWRVVKQYDGGHK